MGLKSSRRGFFVGILASVRRVVCISFLLLLSSILLIQLNGLLRAQKKKMILPKWQRANASSWTRLTSVMLLSVGAVLFLSLFDVGKSYATNRPSILSASGGKLASYFTDQSPGPSVSLVMGRTTAEDTTWANHFTRWRKISYTVDDPSAQYSVPENKGHEVMVYLTYIINHYHNLTDITIFHHAGRYQWHVDDPLHDSLRVLSRLRLPYVMQQGYVNLRCVWTLGCPTQVRPLELDHDKPVPEDANEQEYLFKPVFESVLPEDPIPEDVGVPCCSQFAVTGSRIQARPLSAYIAARRWLLETQVESDMAGRVMEHIWHIMFGAEAVHCPKAGECYCKTFGVCNLEVKEEGVGREKWQGGQEYWNFTLKLPEGWPRVGWGGEERDVEGLRRLQEKDVEAV